MGERGGLGRTVGGVLSYDLHDAYYSRYFTTRMVKERQVAFLHSAEVVSRYLPPELAMSPLISPTTSSSLPLALLERDGKWRWRTHRDKNGCHPKAQARSWRRGRRWRI
jgi:hypothetical protein